jgi:hypothetical protein
LALSSNPFDATRAPEGRGLRVKSQEPRTERLILQAQEKKGQTGRGVVYTDGKMLPPPTGPRRGQVDNESINVLAKADLIARTLSES